MAENPEFDSQLIGFYFAINGLLYSDLDEISEAQFEAASAIHSRAYALLTDSLPASGMWEIGRGASIDIPYSPFAICDDRHQQDSLDGDMAFSFWVRAERKMSEKEVAAFRNEVTRAYEQASAELGGSCLFLRCESIKKDESYTRTTLFR